MKDDSPFRHTECMLAGY